MTDNELLFAISGIMDKKLKPINERLEEHSKKFEVIEARLEEHSKKFEIMDEHLKKIELVHENDILPRLQNIESCYTSTYNRYRAGTDQIDAMQSDIDVMKNVIREHSEYLYPYYTWQVPFWRD